MLFIFVGFAFPVTFATCLSMVFLLGTFSGVFFEGLTGEVSVSVGMPREDSNRLAVVVIVWFDCFAVGVIFVWASVVVFSTACCVVVSGLGMVVSLSFATFRTGGVEETGGLFANFLKLDDS